MKITTKLITVILIATLSIVPKSFAAGSYAGRGALIGALSGGTLGAILFSTVVYNQDCSMDYGEDFCGPGFYGIVGFGLGALVGAGIGAGIGAAIPKQPKYQVIPIINPDPKSLGAGVNLSVNF